MKKFKAVIFDMDGTIVDTSSIWKTVNALFLIKRNLWTEENFNSINVLLHGVPVKEHIKEFKKTLHLEKESDEIIINEYDALIKENYELEIKYIIECEAFIQKLLLYNIPIAVATNSCDYGIGKVNNIVNLRQYFNTHIYGKACVNNIAKPAPDIFLYAAKQLNIDPEDCIVFEDSAHGVTAAKKASMFTIAINTSGIKNTLIHADKIIDCYSEINLNDYFVLDNIKI
jgi:HAD superfamily hydrolase (TIGR01509 family)